MEEGGGLWGWGEREVLKRRDSNGVCEWVWVWVCMRECVCVRA